MPATLESPIRHGVRVNAKTWANKFEARFLEAGLVNYEDCGCGTNLLSHETIARCAQTFVGRPVIVRHKHLLPENLEDKDKDGKPIVHGYIADVWFNSEDGWWWCSGTIHDERAKELIRKGWKVSCSYSVSDTAPGGAYHNARYDEEITAFEGMHLAIVDNPRYERAVIRLNSKPTPSMFKFLKKLLGGETKDNAAAPTPEEVSGESSIEVNGQPVALTALVEKYNSVPSDEVDVDGKKVKINDLVAGYKANEAAKAKEEEDKKERENAVKVAAAKKAEDDAKAKAAFDELENARHNSQLSEDQAASIDTLEQRMERARVRYSLKPKTS